MKIRAHPDAELAQAQLEELVHCLTNKRRELADTFGSLNQQITTKDDCSVADAAEAASRHETRIRAAGMVDQNKETMAEIDSALNRLANGQYGISEFSGEPIPYERLLLVPWARSGVNEVDRTHKRND